MPATLFISDLHLSPERPAKLELFRQLLRGPAREAGTLYILGDLFEQFWVGNDDRTPPNPEIIAALAEATAAGTRIFFQRGNRELMLDGGFEALTGCRLLPDETVIELGGERVLLLHGDLLCSADVSYQRYRRFLEAGPVRGLFRNLPYGARIRLAHGLRPHLRRSADQKPEAIVDADQDTVEETMRRHGVRRLIHGHTHRPGRHAFILNGATAERIVLSDWYKGDSVLVYRNETYKLTTVETLVSGSEV